MTYWKYELDVADLWHDWHGKLTFEQFRDAFVARIGASRWFNEHDVWLTEIYDSLQHAADLRDFDNALDEFYDYADHYRIWVNR